MSKGHLFIVSGASGVGKSTVLKKVMAAREDLMFSVSATTRDPRPSETDGVDYTFLTRAAFQELIDQDAFWEYDEHNDTFYGTPAAQAEEKLTRGNVILDVEPNGAFNVQKKRADATLIFIMPPSMEELERRLRGRNDTSEEQVQKRLKRAVWEMDQREKYDHMLVNDDADECARKLLQIIAEKADEI